MVGNDENVLVEFDYQNIVLVDPNKTINSQGVVKERQVRHEDLVFYANLECVLFPRTRLSVGSNGNYGAETISIAKINFLKPGDKTFLTNEYYDDISGLDKISGRDINKWVDDKNSISKSDKPSDAYIAQSDGKAIDTELLGITQINIDTNLNFSPEVTIEMEDIRGRALFEQGENSPYAVFFNYPYPLFYLTVKGYYGKAIKYQLALRTFNARFDTSSGNFKITVKFYAYKYNILTQLPIRHLLALPYMYMTKYTISPTNTVSAQSAQNQVGSGTKDVTQKTTSKGLLKIKEVYSEYKAKGLVDEDFPEITLPELIVRLGNLETYIANTFTEADMAPLTDAQNYQSLLNSFEGDVFFYQGESWFSKYLDDKNFFIEKNTGRKLYTFKETVRQNGDENKAIGELKTQYVEGYKLKLAQNKTFGTGGKYKIKGKEFPSEIPNNITYNNFVPQNINPDNLDLEETYFERIGKRPTPDELQVFKTAIQPVFNSSGTQNGQKVWYWYYFEGPNSFTKMVEDMQNLLNSKITEIQNKLAEVLSERLQSKEGGLGFKPSIKNIIAVILASSEGFIRLMCDVHESAWNERDNKYRIQAVLGNDKTVSSTDAKNSVQTSKGNLIPIYPWPQYFVETNDEKGEKFELTYPGDPKVVSKTKGYLYNVWPEIQFVEEFIKGKTLIANFSGDPGSTTNEAQVVNRVSLNALDFPTNNVIFANKQESKFLYEIWERVFLSANYQRYMRPGAENQISDLIAESEFLNIQKSLSTDSPYLIQKLKKYGFTSANFVPFLAAISNNGQGESWQKYIRDEFVTNYIQQEVDNSFVIMDESVVAPGNNIVQVEPTQLGKLSTYLGSTETNVPTFTDSSPFSITNWFKDNLANGNASNQNEIYNTTKTLKVNLDKKMVASFTPQDGKKTKRPITNFNFYDATQPTPNSLTLDSFYMDREDKDYLPTEGGVFYKNYSGNVTDFQSTSIMNTPYFVNSIQEGVTNWLTGNTHPYTSSAFLLLNSLPLATLREKFKTYDGGNTTDLDYIFATLKKFGAIHKLPYAWILKYGSIWYRYKVWVESGSDILQNSWTDFDTTKNFDPVTLDPNKVYNLTVSGSPQLITVQKVNGIGGNTLSEINVGFYPKVVNDFNLFCRGYDLFTGYTDSDIQTQLNDTNGGFTLTFNDKSAFEKPAGYDPSDITDILRFKPWSCTLIDKKDSKQYVLPSWGIPNNVNQSYSECFNSAGKLTQSIKSNPSVFNGSVRSLWSLSNYGYFDNDRIDIPSPAHYMKTVLTGSSQQESFSLNEYSGYTNIEEMFSVFDKEVLDSMENEFLKFSKSMYDYEVQQVDDLILTRVQIDNLALDKNATYKNFQLLMKEMLTIVPTNGNDSETIVKNIQEAQFTKVMSTILNFLEYDVVIKYSNPSGYDRRLYDSFIDSKFLEDKITFNPYIQGSLPSIVNTGNTIPFSAYTTSHPQSWKDLQTYVGFSTIPGMEYSRTGSTITDFFIDMNIEFMPDSVKQLAPLIKIYSTYKKNDPTFNMLKFKSALKTYTDTNQKFTDLVLNSLFQKIQKNLPDIVEVKEKTDVSALQGEQTKLELWESFKALNDTWVAGYDYTQTTFMEDVLLMDRANRNIGDLIFIDPFKTKNILKSAGESSGNVYSYLESILDVHHFICMMSPAYINYYNVQEVQKENVPKIEGSLDFANNLFGTFLNVDTRSATPKLVCTYAAEPSEHLNMEKNDNSKYKSDAFEMRRSSENPLTDKLDGKTDWGLSNRVVGFNVDIGVRNQNIFKDFNVSQDLGKQTAESLTQMDNMINQANGRQSATQNVSLWNFYKKRSYKSEVTCLGNVMIQPTMYYNLRYVPMFYGPYYIMEVKHNITPGKFETRFTGMRQQVFALPKLDNYMQTLTKSLFAGFNDKLKQNVSTNSTGQPQSGNSNPTTNRQPGVNTFVIDNSQNCSGTLSSSFTGYIPATQKETRMNSQTLATGIKSHINGGSNPTVNRLLAFITIYLQSYQGNDFVCWNNNYCGAVLNYNWPGGLKNYFTKEYLCQKGSNGVSSPFAIFETDEKMYKFLEAKWGPVSGNVSISAENILENWFRKFNHSTWTIAEFNDFKTNNDITYKNYLASVESAMTLAKVLGIY